MKLARCTGAVALALALAGSADARVVRISVERREPVLAGRPFGLAGPYETLVGTVEFALDPACRSNQAVVDLALAPRNAQGDVVFSADLYLLKPKDLARGNGRVYYEVPNRGGKGILRRLQYARSSLDPRDEADFGDGWLMEQGFALVWMGWQWDVPEAAWAAAAARADRDAAGREVTGLVRAAVLVDERKAVGAARRPRPRRLSARRAGTAPTAGSTFATTGSTRPASSHAGAGASSTATKVALDGGFEPGRLYEVVYKSRDPRVVGCGLAATRDLVSFFKNEPGRGEPARRARRSPTRTASRRAAASCATCCTRASTRTSRAAASSTA